MSCRKILLCSHPKPALRLEKATFLAFENPHNILSIREAFSGRVQKKLVGLCRTANFIGAESEQVQSSLKSGDRIVCRLQSLLNLLGPIFGQQYLLGMVAVSCVENDQMGLVQANPQTLLDTGN